MTYFASCGCGIEVSQDDSHCSSCGDPIVPTPEVSPEVRRCEEMGAALGMTHAQALSARKFKEAVDWIDRARETNLSLCFETAKSRVLEGEAYLRGAMAVEAK